MNVHDVQWQSQDRRHSQVIYKYIKIHIQVETGISDISRYLKIPKATLDISLSPSEIDISPPAR